MSNADMPIVDIFDTFAEHFMKGERDWTLGHLKTWAEWQGLTISDREAFAAWAETHAVQFHIGADWCTMFRAFEEATA